MKIQIGSKVKFLNDVGGGIVKGFQDDKMVLVETDDGFEIPVLATNLIYEGDNEYEADRNSDKRQKSPSPDTVTEKDRISPEEKKYIKHQGEILLALVPQNDKLLHVSDFDLFLINDSNYYFQFSLFTKENTPSHIETGSIEPDTKLLIDALSQTDLGKIKAFHLQGSYFKYGFSDILQPISEEFDISEVSFYKSIFFQPNDYFDSNALILSKEKGMDMHGAVEKLRSGEIAGIAKIKEMPETKKGKLSKSNSEIVEVDLHIHEIVDDDKGMSPSEILDVQLSRFETALETAINSNTLKIVFIHGVGNGKLKHELRKKLERKYANLRYQDASFKEYGYGATMVYLKG